MEGFCNLGAVGETSLLPDWRPQHLRPELIRGLKAFRVVPSRRERMQQIVPPHSITSSASNCTALGTSMPSARAVCRLMTNSNVVDCTTGRSAGFVPFEDLTGVDANLVIHVQKIGPIARQSTDFDMLATGIDRGNPMARCQRRKLDAPTAVEPVRGDEEGIGTVAREGGTGRLDLAAGARVENLNLQPESACSFWYVS